MLQLKFEDVMVQLQLQPVLQLQLQWQLQLQLQQLLQLPAAPAAAMAADAEDLVRRFSTRLWLSWLGMQSGDRLTCVLEGTLSTPLSSRLMALV